MNVKAVLRQEDGRIGPFWTIISLSTTVSDSGIDRCPPGMVVWELHFRKLRGNFAVCSFNVIQSICIRFLVDDTALRSRISIKGKKYNANQKGKKYNANHNTTHNRTAKSRRLTRLLNNQLGPCKYKGSSSISISGAMAQAVLKTKRFLPHFNLIPPVYRLPVQCAL